MKPINSRGPVSACGGFGARALDRKLCAAGQRGSVAGRLTLPGFRAAAHS
jgi:hypothetical protein